MALPQLQSDGKRKRSTVKLWKVRRNLYRGARILGDVEAVADGPKAVAKRIERRWIWRIVGRLLRKV
jgi:hypothetical protein